MLKAYFDESEPDDVSILTIAGYVSTENRWQAFEHKWKSMQEEFGIERFHMADFIANQGEFRGWENEPAKRARCIGKVARIIREHAYMRASCTIALPDYKTVVKASEPDNPNIVKAFTICAATAMSGVELWTRNRGSKEKIAYVFEQGHKHCGEIVSTFRNAPKHSRALRSMYRLGSVAAVRKDDAAMLQAADILALQTARHAAVVSMSTARPSFSAWHGSTGRNRWSCF